MRSMLALAALLYSAAAFAQSNPPSAPPLYGGKPLLQVKPKAVSAKQPSAKQSAAAKLQACLDIDDGTKDRLNCYDAIYAPKPNPKAGTAKAVADCRLKKEEDERLACFNDFAERIPKLPRS